MHYEYINKDISWLFFNERVLDEAADSSLSISQRLRFLAIFSNNLDEFYHFKVFPYIRKQSKLVDSIFEIVKRLEITYIDLLNELLFDVHADKDFRFVCEFNSSQSLLLNYFFEAQMKRHLSYWPLSSSSDILLKDNCKYFVANYGDSLLADCVLIELSPDFTQSIVSLDSNTYCLIEDVLRFCLPKMHNDKSIIDVYSFKILRHLNIKARGEGDCLDFILEGIKKRMTAGISAVFYDLSMPDSVLEHLLTSLRLSSELFVPTSFYSRFSDLLSTDILAAPSSVNCSHKLIDKYSSVLKAVLCKDLLLHYPYHSFDYLLLLLDEAASDVRVREISITWYRASKSSLILDKLIAAAKNGKRVRVVVELKAKLEERKNIDFASLMALSGIEVVFTNINMKVHSKILLITLEGQRFVSYVSTGNFNENTAKIYTDHALITTSKRMGNELSILFDDIESGKIASSYSYLLVSPVNLKSAFVDKIEREICYAKAGLPASLVFKMNGLQDSDMIDLLYRASEAGVKIKLMVRGMCRLLPNKSYSENIHLVRIVDKFLEHGRMYYFHNNGNSELFMGSADLMTKKLEKRVELMFPLEDKFLKRECMAILDLLFADNQKLSFHLGGRSPERFSSVANKRRAQEDVLNYLEKCD